MRIESTLDDAPSASPTALPSRLVVAIIPVAWMAFALVVQGPLQWDARPLGYVEGGWIAAAISLVLGAPVIVVAYVVLKRTLGRVRIGGQVASPIALVALVLFGVAPFVYRALSRALESANTDGVEAGPPERARCIWTVAHQFPGHVAVHAECELEDGTPFSTDIDLASASAVDGADIELPTWRGRHWGRLIAHDAYTVLHR